MTTRLSDVLEVLEGFYPAATAEAWDAVGLVCGDPAAPVRGVLLAVDPVAAVVDEVVAGGYDLLLTHHPLYLHGTTSVAATTSKGRVVHRLLSAGAALHVAHTNADVADPGVSDALAGLFDLRDLRPLAPSAGDARDKLVVHVPVGDAERLRDALAAAGASATVGRVEQDRLELVLPRGRREAVLRALHEAHPYEEPAYDLVELATVAGTQGLGRVGDLPEPLPLRELTERAAAVLPATAWGVRTAGDPDAVVSRLAVCGGSGDGLLREAAHAGAQAYLTSDLRHHPASEAPEGLALLDAAHWATEWPWLGDAARRLTAATTVETVVSTLVTDPWTHAVRSTAEQSNAGRSTTA